MKHVCPHTDRKIFARGKCKWCCQAEYNERRIEKQKENTEGRTAIPKMTDLTQALNAIYSILMSELKPLHTVCEGKLSGCSGVASEIHHKKGRDGILLIISKYYCYLCNSCHSFCTEHSAEAISIGLSIRRNSPTEYEFTKREIELIEQYNIRMPVQYTVT